jgi:Lrp/AsnC family transcriptional regulator for asnA, asnC and gidA
MLGFDVCAYIGIRLQDVSILMQTVDRLKQIPEIVECHFITGTYNLFVKLYCVDNEHLMTTLCDRILAIPGISTTQTYISLNEAFQRQIYVDCLHD